MVFLPVLPLITMEVAGLQKSAGEPSTAEELAAGKKAAIEPNRPRKEGRVGKREPAVKR